MKKILKNSIAFLMLLALIAAIKPMPKAEQSEVETAVMVCNDDDAPIDAIKNE